MCVKYEIMNYTYDRIKPWGKRPTELGYLLLFFFIWPFGAWLYSLFCCAKTKGAYIIFFLFSILLCWHFAPQHTGVYDDFLGILDRFKHTNLSTSELLYQLESYFAGSDSSEKEIYEITLNWFSRLFTDNYHFFFLLAAIPVALCQLKTMMRITGDVRFRNGSVLGVVLLILFILPRDIITVQNPRFVTGFWLAVLGTIRFFTYYKNNKYHWSSILLILMAPLCHSAFLVYVIIFVVGFFARPKKWLETAALVSIPFTLFDAGVFNGLSLPFLPSSIQRWMDIYMSDEAYAEFVLHEGRAGFWWVSALFSTGKKIVYVVMTYQLIKNKDIIFSNFESSRLYSFYLTLFAIVNMVQFIPVLGERYYWFLQVFCLFVWFKAFGFTRSKWLWLLLVSCSFGMFMRYGYLFGGALSVTTNPDMFFTPLPYLIATGFTY